MTRRKKNTWTPGLIEPREGKCYFVHDESRMTRVWDMGTRPVPEKQGWRQVDLETYVAYRKDTLLIPLKRRKAMHALLYKDKPCKSKQLSPLPPTTKSPTVSQSKKSGMKPSEKSNKPSPTATKVRRSKSK